MQPIKNFYNLLCHVITHVNFKFQCRKNGTIITIFSSLGKQGYYESIAKTKFIVTYLSCPLQEKQGYTKSKNILSYEMSLVYAKSLG
jgi:hypothetical protein